MNKLPKIGFMFGAGAELSYNMPKSGEFSLEIFRKNALDTKQKKLDKVTGKELFRDMIKNIDSKSEYSKWFPDNFNNKLISSFGRKNYEDIVRNTIEENRQKIIEGFEKLDDTSKDIVKNLIEHEKIDIDQDFFRVNGIELKNASTELKLADEFSYFDKESDKADADNDQENKDVVNSIFNSRYFSSLLQAYIRFSKDDLESVKGELSDLTTKLGTILLSLLQLLVGAAGKKLIDRLNTNVFASKPDELKFLDDFGSFLQLDYKDVGLIGIEYIFELDTPEKGVLKNKSSKERILFFAERLIEKIYSNVLDYKTLIDSNWMYLYRPDRDWSKFCKISIFLINVRNYIIEKCKNTKDTGYYEELADAISKGNFEISAIGTSNYSPLIQEKLHQKVTYLNGSTGDMYDPYLNLLGTKEDLAKNQHLIVPLLFTQSGTKAMTCVDMSLRYANFYQKLLESDLICVVGFGFNSDDDHINGIFRRLVEKDKKTLVVVDSIQKGTEDAVIQEIKSKLKISDEAIDSRLKVILVDDKNKDCQSLLWTDALQKIIKDVEKR